MNPNEDFDLSSLRAVVTDLRFPEGPIALDDGTVLVSEIEGAALARVAPNGEVTRIHVGGGANGAAFGPDGAVYVNNSGGHTFATDEDGIRYVNGAQDGYVGGTVQRVDLDTGEVTDVFTHVDGERLGGLNDIVFDGTGCCYVVDTIRGEVHYADVAGRTISTVSAGLSFPNGMGLSPDGDRLYVSETNVGNIDVWDVVGPGQLADQRVLFNDEGEHGFDGLAVDGAGNICAANLAASGVSVINPDGEEIARFQTPFRDTFVTNVCFGGPDPGTAYVTSSGRGILYSLGWPWGGHRLHFAR